MRLGLHRAEQSAEIWGGAAGGRGGGETDETDQEGPPPTEHVGQASPEEQQAAEREGVGSNDPLALDV